MHFKIKVDYLYLSYSIDNILILCLCITYSKNIINTLNPFIYSPLTYLLYCYIIRVSLIN